jgi:hypothetical protein
MAAFVVRSAFGFALAAFCAGGLLFEMSEDSPGTEFVTMYFSLLSFVAGYFLGASPKLKRGASPSSSGPATTVMNADTSGDSASL